MCLCLYLPYLCKDMSHVSELVITIIFISSKCLAIKDVFAAYIIAV